MSKMDTNPRRPSAGGASPATAMLAQRFHDGDETVLADVLRGLGGGLCRRLAAKYRSLLALGDAEEIVNAALAHAWERHAAFDETRAPLSAWLFVIADHAAADFLASRSGQGRLVELAMAPGELAELAVAASDDPDGDDGADGPPSCRAVLHQLVRQALAALPAKEAYVLLADASCPTGKACADQLAAELNVQRCTV